MRRWLIIIALIVPTALYSVNRNKTVNATQGLGLNFIPVVGDKMFSFDSSYINQTGETFTITKCLFYVSNFSITYKTGKRIRIPNSYFLINLSDPLSSLIRLPVPANNVSAIDFLLGVDSAKNTGGIQRGVLDPARGMFWTWNTGYVMAKMEGVSPVANMPGHKFSYHIGGYSKGQQVTKSISLPVTSKFNDEKPIDITADLLRWFNGPLPISIAAHPSCHSPGQLARQISGNYQYMFGIKQYP